MRTQPDAIRAWKRGRISHVAGDYFFEAVSQQVRYGVTDVAQCRATFMSVYGVVDPAPHGPVPKPECSCGFYAVNNPTDVKGFGGVLLEVDLYGTVLVCENGYRAEKQRVLSVEVQRCCFCARRPRAFRLVAPPVVPHHPGIISFAVPGRYVTAACDEHLDDIGGGPVVPMDHLASLIGTEVRTGGLV